MRRSLFRRGRVAAATLAAALVVGAQAFPATAEKTQSPPPVDFTKVAGLSQPVYGPAQIVRERVELEVPEDPANPGGGTINLYMEVVRPNVAGKFPVILEAAPYHGTLLDRNGTRILPEPRENGKSIGLTGYFPPRGYAVVMMDLRGTGRSEGCLDHLGPRDAQDLEMVVEWAAGQPWSNGRVGMTGHSYVGSTPMVAAAQNPRGLATIVPSAGLASMYHHQFQAGVPFFLQWAGPQWAYEWIAMARHYPPIGNEPVQNANTGDNFGNDMEYFGCGWRHSALTSGLEAGEPSPDSQLSGEYTSWHAARDWNDGATAWRGPVFNVHGVNDNAARITSMDWFNDRVQYFRQAGLKRPDDKLWLGQWNHGSGCCPNRRGIQWTLALHAWFDRWLKKLPVDTGPAVEAFLADGTFAQVTASNIQDEIFTANRWPVPAQEVSFFPAADATMSGQTPAAGSVSFTGDPRGFTNAFGGGGVTFETQPFQQDVLFMGLPELDLRASTTMPRVHLIAGLYDVWTEKNAQGQDVVQRRRITEFAINPELRNGIEETAPVVPGTAYDLQPPGFAMGHKLPAGHRLALRITTSSPDKAPLFAVDPRVTVFTGPDATELRLPVVPNATLYEDNLPLTLPFPLGPAQPSITGSASPGVPTLGETREDGIDSDFFEFDVEDGYDNARIVAEGKYDLPADIDLFLQKRNADGTWGPDITAGTSSMTTNPNNEVLSFGRLVPGHYRIEVNNYSGAPQEVRLTIDFFNQLNEKGAAPA